MQTSTLHNEIPVKRLILWLLIFIPMFAGAEDLSYGTDNSFIVMDSLNTIAGYLEKRLMKFHMDHTLINLLPSNDNRVPVKEIHPEEMIENMEMKVSKLFNERRKTLENIVSALEEATVTYTWTDDLKNDFSNIVYMNSSTKEAYKDYPAELNERFGVKINPTLASVHVPLEIYQGYPEVVNGLQWSSAVDAVFKENFEQDDSLSWQFFASEAGYLRMYPSVLSWYIPPPYDPVDLFDSKRRPWYVQGAVSPKDVIILMDRSGSVHGQTFTILKFAVEMLLDTLSEDDFVNIAAFNETTHWVSRIAYEDDETIPEGECLEYNQTLIQATNVNKRALVNDMHFIKDAGMSNYTDALRFAFETFKERANNGDRGSNCLKVIMMFTDGGTDWPKEILDQYGNDTDTEDVRIFTYAVGPHPIPVAVLKDMSCLTGGKLTTIMTSSGVRTKIQGSYFDVLSRSLAMDDAHVLQFTSAYTSAVTQNLTMTMSMPVFNKSLELDNATLVGVAGVDIPVHQVNNLSPRLKMGPLGYTFIINGNGFLSLHPRLFAQQSYLQDPPHIDILDLELNPVELSNVRRHMIDGGTGSFVVNKRILIDDKHILNTGRLQYMYRPIEGTSYSLGMVVVPRSKYLDILHDLPPYLLDEETTLLAPWNFCGSQPSAMNASQINEMTDDSQVKCDRSLIRGLYWAHQWTNVMTSRWKFSLASDYIINKAVFTTFGYSAVFVNHHYQPDELEIEDDSLPGVDWRDPGKNPALKQGVLSNNLQIFPHLRGAFISKAAVVNGVSAGAAGLNVSSKYLDEELRSVIADALPNSNVVVLLVDQSGYVITSTSNSGMSGTFLGTHWPLLLEKLTEAGIYDRQPIRDFYALCDTKKAAHRKVSAGVGRLFFEPLKIVISTLWRFLAIFESMQYLLLYGFTSIPEADAVHNAAGFNDSCIIEKHVYYFTNKMQFSGNITCLGDSAQVHVKRLNQTNAVLIAVEESLRTLSCDGWMDKALSTPEEKSIVEPKVFACRQPRYRKIPTDCYSEVTDKCSHSPGLGTSIFTFWIVVGLMFLIR